MLALDVVVVVLMAVGLVVFLGEPLVRRPSSHLLQPPSGRELEELTLQKETLYTAIHDLDFDYQTGKVDQHDYTELRRDLEEEAIQTLRQLDAVDPLAALDGELERQIAVIRRSPLPHPTREDVCRSCGARRQDDGNFCASCGQSFCPS